jgi:hypothetical protein
MEYGPLKSKLLKLKKSKEFPNSETHEDIFVHNPWKSVN